MDKSFYDIGSTDDLKDIWDADMDPSMHDVLRLHSGGDGYKVEDEDRIPCGVIIHDRLMTDAAFVTMAMRPIKNEHSYSLDSSSGDCATSDVVGGQNGGAGCGRARQHHRKDDMEDECFPAISMSKACRKTNDEDDDKDEEPAIKQEPVSETDSLNSSCPSSPQSALFNDNLQFTIDFKESQQLLRKSGLMLNADGAIVQTVPNVKVETASFQLPPTPPSCSSDSDDNVTGPASPYARKARLVYSAHSTTRQPIHTHLISSQPKGSTGSLILTEEEKRTLIAEGYPIPTRLPLSKAEEKSLKKIRRKIKNKISAQESRRKKKEYMDQLERKVQILVSENNEYRKKVESLEGNNNSLLTQLRKLQAVITKTHPQLAKQMKIA